MENILIRINDVVDAGSVEAAIIAASQSADWASGDIGPTFATSGPGSGWTKEYTSTDYARRALADDYGAIAYVDPDDGRVATLSGDGDGDVVWSEASEVVVEVPCVEDALRHPKAAMQMAISVRDEHHAASDVEAWRELLSDIQTAAEKLEGIEMPSAE